MPTKATQQEHIQELERKNQKYLLALVQISTSTHWDAKTIRNHVKEVIKEAVNAE